MDNSRLSATAFMGWSLHLSYCHIATTLIQVNVSMAMCSTHRIVFLTPLPILARYVAHARMVEEGVCILESEAQYLVSLPYGSSCPPAKRFCPKTGQQRVE